MQSNNNTPTTPSPANPPATTPMNPGGDIVFKDKPKKSTGMIIGMVVFALLAAGGIGFGVWTYLDGNQKTADLNNQISDLQNQLVNSGTTNIDETETEIVNPNHPIITTELPAAYTVRYSIPVYFNHTDSNSYLNVTSSNGKDIDCNITNAQDSTCEIKNVPEGVYKIVTIFEGNGPGGEKIGFLMSDGSVWYTSIYDENFNVNRTMNANKLKLDGTVKDIVEVNYTSDTNAPTGWYASTVFVMDDGSIVKYDESML